MARRTVHLTDVFENTVLDKNESTQIMKMAMALRMDLNEFEHRYRPGMKPGLLASSLLGLLETVIERLVALEDEVRK